MRNIGRNSARCFAPQALGHRERGNLNVGPPGYFIAVVMQLPMMFAAQRHREFVAYFAAERSRLCKFQVMRIARCALTDEARLRRDKSRMRLVSPADGLEQGRYLRRQGAKRGLIDNFDSARPQRLAYSWRVSVAVPTAQDPRRFSGL